MPQHPDRRMPDGQVLPDPEDGDRAQPARNGLDLPGPGELRLGGGQAVVAFAETGQVGGGEGVSEGRGGDTGTITGALHESSPLAELGAGLSANSGRSRLFGAGVQGEFADGLCFVCQWRIGELSGKGWRLTREACGGIGSTRGSPPELSVRSSNARRVDWNSPGSWSLLLL